MDTRSPEAFSLFKVGAEFIWVLVAMLGGVARYLDTYIRTGAAPRLGLLLAHALISGFSGYMVAQTVIQFSTQWALVAAGVGGYLGTQGLDWMATVLRDRVVGGTIPGVAPTPPLAPPPPPPPARPPTAPSIPPVNQTDLGRSNRNA